MGQLGFVSNAHSHRQRGISHHNKKSKRWSERRKCYLGRLVQRENPRTDLDLFSPYSADRLIKAGIDEQIIYATERVSKENPHIKLVQRKNPQMTSWYAAGARIMADGAMGSKSSEARPSLH